MSKILFVTFIITAVCIELQNAQSIFPFPLGGKGNGPLKNIESTLNNANKNLISKLAPAMQKLAGNDSACIKLCDDMSNGFNKLARVYGSCILNETAAIGLNTTRPTILTQNLTNDLRKHISEMSKCLQNTSNFASCLTEIMESFNNINPKMMNEMNGMLSKLMEITKNCCSQIIDQTTQLFSKSYKDAMLCFQSFI